MENIQPLRAAAEFDQAAAAAKNLAGLMVTYYDTLKSGGLNDDAALTLTLDYQQFVLSPKG